MKYIQWILIWAGMLVGRTAYGQNTLTEGRLVYDVQMAPTGTNKDLRTKEEKATYSIFIKGAKVCKVLAFENSGYQSITLYDYNKQTIYALMLYADKKIAVQLLWEDMLEAAKPYLDFKCIDEKNTPSTADSCQEAQILYASGAGTRIRHNAEWKLKQKYIYDRMPGMENVLCRFDYPIDGVQMVFTLRSVAAELQESAQFRIPPGYKVISHKEYKELTR
jgi:hypothetical protein